MRNPNLGVVSILAFASLVGACGNEVIVLGDDTAADECTPGMTRACYGLSNCPGAQACLPNGSGWGSCDCGSGANGSGGGWGASGNYGGWGASGNYGGWGASGNYGGWGASGNYGGWGPHGAGGPGGQPNTAGNGGGWPSCVPEICNGFDDDCNGLVDDGPTPCSCQAHIFGDHVYLFCPIPLFWDDASAYCHARGMHLTTISNAAENGWVSARAAVLSTDRWWMGFSDLVEEGAWVWEDGSPVTYTDWYAPTSEPNGWSGENCGQLLRFYVEANGSYAWNDEGCEQGLFFVCESIAGNGCSDGTREGFVDPSVYPRIAACAGGFSVPGVIAATDPSCNRQAGNSSANPDGVGCSAADLCSPGYHVCTGAPEVAARSPTGCAGAASGPGLFFVSRQGSTGCLECTLGTNTDPWACTGCSCTPGCAPSVSAANDLWGCGTAGEVATTCGVFNRRSAGIGNGACSAIGSAWRCGMGDCTEGALVMKSAEAGGVLCCAD